MGIYLSLYFNEEQWKKLEELAQQDGFETVKDYIKSSAFKHNLSIFQELQQIQHTLKKMEGILDSNLPLNK
jgi:hypothetical protein